MRGNSSNAGEDLNFLFFICENGNRLRYTKVVTGPKGWAESRQKHARIRKPKDGRLSITLTDWVSQGTWPGSAGRV